MGSLGVFDLLDPESALQHVPAPSSFAERPENELITVEWRRIRGDLFREKSKSGTMVIEIFTLFVYKFFCFISLIQGLGIGIIVLMFETRSPRFVNVTVEPITTPKLDQCLIPTFVNTAARRTTFSECPPQLFA